MVENDDNNDTLDSNYCENPIVRSMEYDDTSLPLKLDYFSFQVITHAVNIEGWAT